MSEMDVVAADESEKALTDEELTRIAKVSSPTTTLPSRPTRTTPTTPIFPRRPRTPVRLTLTHRTRPPVRTPARPPARTPARPPRLTPHRFRQVLDDLKHEQVAERIAATGQLVDIAAALGGERTRDELIPFLVESTDDEGRWCLVVVVAVREFGRREVVEAGGQWHRPVTRDPPAAIRHPPLISHLQALRSPRGIDHNPWPRPIPPHQ